MHHRQKGGRSMSVDPSSGVAWCHCVIRHAVITEVRRRRHRHREIPLSCLSEVDRVSEWEAVPSEGAVRDFSDSEVRLFLRCLPQAEQAVLRLLYLSGLTQSKAADRLGWRQQQVSRLHRLHWLRCATLLKKRRDGGMEQGADEQAEISALMKRIQGGDATALAEWFRRLDPFIRRQAQVQGRADEDVM